MLKRLFAALGIGAATAAASAASTVPPYAPYNDQAADAIYNLLFCDDLRAFTAAPNEVPAQWQSLLASQPPDVAGLKALALDAAQEGRIRALAFGRLRSIEPQPQQRVLLGVITEVGMSGGLDTLAAFSDGGVRYINQSGKMVIVEGRLDATQPLVEALFSVAEPVLQKLQPLNGPRWAPPPKDTIRFTFLTSDGLYLGQGPQQAMARDAKGAPMVKAATDLLLAMIKLGTK